MLIKSVKQQKKTKRQSFFKQIKFSLDFKFFSLFDRFILLLLGSFISKFKTKTWKEKEKEKKVRKNNK